MPLIATAGDSREFELAPMGNHIARCFSIIDLGLQETVWNGEQKLLHKVRIAWELPGERMEDGQPFSISSTYTLSLGDKANLRRDLQSWRGRPFTEEELARFDLFTVLGAPAMVNVVHNPSKDGTRTYANVSSVSPLPKGVDCPDQINPTLAFSIDEHTPEQWEALPDWAKQKISLPKPQEVSQEGYSEVNPPPITDDDIPPF